MNLTPDERALIEHIRQIRKTLADGINLGEQIAVVVITFTHKQTFWRTASDLETSEESKRQLNG